MAKSKVKCSNCRKETLKENGEINRALRNGRKMYCSLECSHLGKRITNESIKYCRCCYELLPINKFRSRIQHGRKYIVARCKKCEIMINKDDRANININRENIRQLREERKSKKKRMMSEYEKLYNMRYCKRWRRRNPEWVKRDAKKRISQLSDEYIMNQARNQGFKDYKTQKRIDQKRSEILLFRIKLKLNQYNHGKYKI